MTSRSPFGPREAQAEARKLALALVEADLPTDRTALLKHLEAAVQERRPDLTCHDCSAVAFRAAKLLQQAARRPLRPTPKGSNAGKEIRQRRRALGLPTADLAARTGLPPYQIIQYETGARAVPCDHLTRLHTVLKDAEREQHSIQDKAAPPAPPADEPDAEALYALYRTLPSPLRRHIVALMRAALTELAGAFPGPATAARKKRRGAPSPSRTPTPNGV